MILRKFEADDSKTILSWIKNEREFRMWSADRFGDYPITPDELAVHYDNCEKTGLFFPFSAADDSGSVVGHMIIRYTDSTKSEARFGFVIVDSSLRGQGIGREMLGLAKEYAANVLRVKRVSLGVFENNTAAMNCYKAAGFMECAGADEFFDVLDERWKCIEMALDI